MRIIRLFSLLVCALACTHLGAKVRLEPLFSDNMVLQQKSDVKIWGEDQAGKIIKITTSWNSKSYTVQTDRNGHWIATVSTPEAGGPYNVTISDGRPVVLNNVLIGEVWVCSGQSNMELMIGDKVTGYQNEMAQADKYKNVRLFHFEKTTDPAPDSKVNAIRGGWQECNGKNIEDFSAVAYYYARELSIALGCPIGVIETCWGGTPVEAWTSAEALETIPEFKDDIAKIKVSGLSVNELREYYAREASQWDHKIQISDPAAQWSRTDFDDSSWKDLQSPGYIEKQGEPNFDGIYWQRKIVYIPARWAGKDLKLDLAMVDDNDFTYFDGHLIGHTEGCRVNRSYIVPGRYVHKGNVAIAVKVIDFRWNAGIYGDPSMLKLSLSDNDKISLVGTWKYRTSLTLDQISPAPWNYSIKLNYPSALYNGMVNPLVNYAIKGVIWYQGEANEHNPAQYKDMFPLLINDWRAKWGYSFPFYFVQLPNYRQQQTDPGESSNWAGIREAQLNALHLERTGMAVTIDIGEAGNIHPKDKENVGKRLALVALAKTYGKDVEYSGPLYQDYHIEGNKIRLSFSHYEGMKTSDGESLKGFCIAGPDHKFYFADAVIDGNTIRVSSINVPFPVSVRYAWANNPVCNLTNAYCLPASPFRTDNW